MPSTTLRQTVLTAVRHVVVKMGTNLLTRKGSAELDGEYIDAVAQQVSALRGRSVTVTLVSSGAIGAGRHELGLKVRPRDVADLQAVAAVGQPMLMTRFHEAFARRGLKVAQMLLTRDDFHDRVRYLNLRNTISRAHAFGCVPIINENDTVTVAGLQELGFGDNDQLAALVASAVGADAMVLLSVVDGLLDGHGHRVDLVRSVAEVTGLARADKSELGTGGMASKLTAARIVTEAGAVAVIAHGREPRVMERLLGGEPLGTVFAPAPRRLGGRQRWIGSARRVSGTLTLDDGAVAALRRGKSLLPSGVTAVTGTFEKGDLVLLHDPAGLEVGRGLSNYSSEEASRIMGRKSSQFEKLLGRPAYPELVHRDHMVVAGEGVRG